MKGLKYSALCFGIGLALLVQLMSTTHVHADGVKTPRPGFTPPGINTPKTTGVPTRIHFTENTPVPVDSSTPSAHSNTRLPATPAPADSSTPNLPLNTHLPTRIDLSVSTKNTSTAGPLNATPSQIVLSPRSTLPATSAAEQGKPSSPGETTVSAESEVGTLSPHPVETTTSGGAQEPTLGDVLQELPENTGVIVLDQGEKPLPLVSQEAAQVITQSDPVWCPGDSTQAPTPGANGCTISYSTVAELVANAGASIAANGTIWITNGPQSLEPGPITIDGSIYTNWANYSLTLQGGWTGTTIGTNSVFNVPIQILNWNAAVTINNITVQNASGSGLGVATNGGNVAINNSSFRNNRAGSTYFPWGDGADISPNGGNVTITNSEFSGNHWDGLYVFNSGQISITDSRFNSNGFTQGSGGGLSAYQIDGIGIGNSEFTGNLSYDITAYCNSGGFLVVSYPDNIPPFPPPVRMDITVDANCSSSAYLVVPTTTHTVTITASATPSGLTLTPTSTPTGPTQAATVTATSSPPSSPLNTPTRFLINTATATPLPTGGFIPTSTPTIPARRPPTVQPRGSFLGASSARPKSKGEFFLDCKLQESFTYPLPNGDKVEIICPSGYWSGKASISRLDNTTLPDKLPAGFTYASAFLVEITKLKEPVQMVNGEFLREEVKVIPEGGYIKASFVALSRGNYSILYWDATNKSWIPLKDLIVDEKGKPIVFDLDPENKDNLLKIISGVQQVSNPLDPRVEVSTNFPGIFVLAQH